MTIPWIQKEQFNALYRKCLSNPNMVSTRPYGVYQNISSLDIPELIYQALKYLNSLPTIQGIHILEELGKRFKDVHIPIKFLEYEGIHRQFKDYINYDKTWFYEKYGFDCNGYIEASIMLEYCVYLTQEEYWTYATNVIKVLREYCLSRSQVN